MKVQMMKHHLILPKRTQIKKIIQKMEMKVLIRNPMMMIRALIKQTNIC